MKAEKMTWCDSKQAELKKCGVTQTVVERLIHKVQVCVTIRNPDFCSVSDSAKVSHLFMVNTGGPVFPWRSILPRQWAAGLFENLTQVSRSGGDWRQQGEGSLPWQRQQRLWTAGPEAAPASSSSWQPGNLLSPLCQPGPERARGQGKTGRQPLPAKQTYSLHFHFIKTNVFLEFLLASCCLFSVGLTVRTEVNWANSDWSPQ